MAKVTSSLDGFEAVRAAFKAAPEKVRVLAGDAVAVSTFATAQGARAFAPRRTGALREAITSKTIGLNGRVGLVGGEVRGERPDVYWRFVEFGTVKVPARPFFRPAAERETEPYLKRLRDIGPKLERDLAAGRLL